MSKSSKCNSCHCHEKKSRFCSSGSRGTAGATGPRGATGPSQLLINNTLFVDGRYGNNASAIPDDEAHPYLTITAALALATAGDVVYVQPGDYVEDGLVLKDDVSMYFTEGTTVTNISAPIFTDSGGPVSVTISGFGDFVSTVSVLQISNGSMVNLAGHTVRITNGYFVDVSSPTHSSINVAFRRIIAQGSTDVFYINGNTDLVVNVNVITSLSTITHITSVATGSASLTMNDGLVNSPDEVFSLNSNDFVLNVSILNFAVTTDSYMIYLNVPTIIPTANVPLCTGSFKFQNVNVIGGFILATGDPAYTTFPLDFNRQPTLYIESSSIYVESTLTAMMTLSYVGLRVNCESISHNIAQPYAIDVVGSNVEMIFQLVLVSNNSLSTGFVSISGTSVFLMLTNGFTNQGTICNCGSGSSALIKASIVFNTSTTGNAVTSFISSGNFALEALSMFIIMPDDFAVSGNHFEIAGGGQIGMIVNTIISLGGNGNFVNCAVNSTATITANNLSINSLGGPLNAFDIRGNLALSVNIVQCNGGNFLSVSNDGNTPNASIIASSVSVNGGNFITCVDGNIVANVGGVSVNGGYGLSNSGNSSNNILFGELSVNNSDIAFNVQSTSTTYLNGNAINANNFNNVFVVGTDTSNIGHLRLQAATISANSVNVSFLTVFGDSYITTGDININGINNDTFVYGNNSYNQVSILNLFVNSNSVNNSLFHVGGSLGGYLGQANANCRIILHDDVFQITLTFNSITCQSGDTIPSAFQFGSGGGTNCILRGNQINLSNCTNGFVFNQGANVWVDAVYMNANNVIDLFTTNNDGFYAYVRCTTLEFGDNIGTDALISVLSGFIQYNGETIRVFSNPPQVVHVMGTSNANIDVDYLTCASVLMNLETAGSIQYATKSSVVNTTLEIVTIQWPTPSTHTLSGYFNTQADNAIVINGVNGGNIRSLGAIIANPFNVANFSINNTTGSNTTIITNSTVATNVFSVDVSVVPPTSFTQDAGVF